MNPFEIALLSAGAAVVIYTAWKIVTRLRKYPVKS